MILLAQVAMSLLLTAQGAAWQPTKREAIAQASAKLRQLKGGAGDEIPADARPIVKALKADLRDSAVELLNQLCADACFQKQLDEALAAEDKVRFGLSGSVDEDGPFVGVDLQVDLIEGASGYAFVRSEVTFRSGAVKSFYVARRTKTAWEVALSLEGTEDERLSRSEREVQVRPFQKTDARWLFLIVDRLEYKAKVRLIGMGPSAATPEVILEREFDSGKEVISDFSFRVTEDGFIASFAGERKLDQDVRFHVHRYRDVDGKLVRSNPVALTPHDFVDAWIAMPWEEARHWVDIAIAKDLQKWHIALRKYDYQGEIEFVQQCDKGRLPQQWDIGVSFFQKGPRTLPGQLFFMVAGTGTSFRLLDITSYRRGGCPGETPWTAYPEVRPPD